MHEPVLLREVLEFLRPSNGDVIVDCTVGGGGHADAILEKVMPDGKLIGIDRDDEAIKAASERLARFKDRVVLRRGNFREVGSILNTLGVGEVNGLLFDLGLSSLQIEDEKRGFSIRLDGPLDMRMSRGDSIDARFIVNRLSEKEIEAIIRDYGEERFSRRIASAIVRGRPVKTTGQLAEITERAMPGWSRRQKIHPATRTFQALRIAVNDELGALRSALKEMPQCLKKGGRVCAISFHSLEDRIVKHALRDYSKSGELEVITKKPVVAGDEERAANPRSRSAKLRVAQKI